MKPKELLFAHRYTEAVEAYRQGMREQPDTNNYLSLGKALLALGNFDEALSAFRKANEMEHLKGSVPCINEAATAMWLAGKQREAMLEWHRAVAGIQDGSIKYGDPAGGGTQGLLLWYGAVTLKDNLERDYALEYLRSIIKRKVYAPAICWPRPIISLILGNESFAEVLRIGNGSPVLSECLEKASKDLLKRRRLCQTLFYVACQERQAGNEAGCIEKMGLCSKLENPIIECEWYLARAEHDYCQKK